METSVCVLICMVLYYITFKLPRNLRNQTHSKQVQHRMNDVQKPILVSLLCTDCTDMELCHLRMSPSSSTNRKGNVGASDSP